MKLYSLLQTKRKITEKRKKFFIVPAVVVVIALIAGLIFGLVKGNPFNITPDFISGYAMTIKSTSFTKDNFKEYSEKIESIIENSEDSDGNKYGLKVYSSYLQGEDSLPSIYVKYSGIRGNKTEKAALMADEVNPALQAEIQAMFDVSPASAAYEGGKVTLVYDVAIAEIDFNEIKEKVTAFCADNGLTASAFELSGEGKIISFSAGSAIETKLEELKTEIALNKAFAGKAEEGVKITAVVTNAILWVSISAIIAAIVLLSIYVAFRFEVSSAVAVLLSVLCDSVFMLAFITVFHIQLSALFFASVGLVLMFSTITKLTVFERIREFKRFQKNKKTSRFEIANTAVSETMVRNFHSSLVMLTLSVLVMAIAVPAVRMFAIPVIFGLLSNIFTTVCLAPSIWTLFKGVEVAAKTRKPKLSKAAKAEKEKTIQNVVNENNERVERRYVPIVETVEENAVETNVVDVVEISDDEIAIDTSNENVFDEDID